MKDIINFAKTAQLHTFGMKTKCPVGAMLGKKVAACRVKAQKGSIWECRGIHSGGPGKEQAPTRRKRKTQKKQEEELHWGHIMQYSEDPLLPPVTFLPWGSMPGFSCSCISLLVLAVVLLVRQCLVVYYKLSRKEFFVQGKEDEK